MDTAILTAATCPANADPDMFGHRDISLSALAVSSSIQARRATSAPSGRKDLKRTILAGKYPRKTLRLKRVLVS